MVIVFVDNYPVLKLPKLITLTFEYNRNIYNIIILAVIVIVATLLKKNNLLAYSFQGDKCTLYSECYKQLCI